MIGFHLCSLSQAEFCKIFLGHSLFLSSSDQIFIYTHEFWLLYPNFQSFLLVLAKFAIILTAPRGILVKFSLYSCMELAEFWSNFYLYSRVVTVFCSNFYFYSLLLAELGIKLNSYSLMISGYFNQIFKRPKMVRNAASASFRSCPSLLVGPYRHM